MGGVGAGLVPAPSHAQPSPDKMKTIFSRNFPDLCIPKMIEA